MALFCFILAFSVSSVFSHPLSRHLPVKSHKVSQLASTFRASALEGQCPTSLTCPLSHFCCPGNCCPSDFPNCSSAGCISSEGQTTCSNEVGEESVGTLCPNLENCCTTAPFTRCSVHFPQYCVDSDGFVACGTPSKRGILCVSQETGSEYCCQNPLKCCTKSVTGCCAEGSGTAEEVAPLVVGEPGTKPKGKQRPVQAAAPVGFEVELDPTAELEVSAEADVSPEESEGSEEKTCFPGDGRVKVRGKGEIRMDEVETGDWVWGKEGWTRVIMWTHRDETWRGWYRQIKVGRKVLRATKGHLVYVGENLKVVEDVNKGDWMGGEKVAAVGWIRGRGLFNPQTEDGSIFVDGVLCSCYTKHVDYRGGHAGLVVVRSGWKLWASIKG